MNGDMPHVPITTLAGIASLTDLLNQLPLPSPLPATTAKGLLYSSRISEEVNNLLVCRDENLVTQLVHSLNQVSTEHIELKDNLGNDEPEGDMPLLLQTLLSRNPKIFRDKSVRQPSLIQQYKVTQNQVHGSPASNYQQTSVPPSPSGCFTPQQSGSGARFITKQNSPISSPYTPQSPDDYLQYNPPSYSQHQQAQQAAGMRNIHDNKVSGQLSNNSNHNAQVGSNDTYMNMTQRLGNEANGSSTKGAAFSVGSPNSSCSPAAHEETTKRSRVIIQSPNDLPDKRVTSVEYKKKHKERNKEEYEQIDKNALYDIVSSPMKDSSRLTLKLTRVRSSDTDHSGDMPAVENANHVDTSVMKDTPSSRTTQESSQKPEAEEQANCHLPVVQHNAKDTGDEAETDALSESERVEHESSFEKERWNKDVQDKDKPLKKRKQDSYPQKPGVGGFSEAGDGQKGNRSSKMTPRKTVATNNGTGRPALMVSIDLEQAGLGKAHPVVVLEPREICEDHLKRLKSKSEDKGKVVENQTFIKQHTDNSRKFDTHKNHQESQKEKTQNVPNDTSAENNETETLRQKHKANLETTLKEERNNSSHHCNARIPDSKKISNSTKINTSPETEKNRHKEKDKDRSKSVEKIRESNKDKLKNKEPSKDRRDQNPSDERSKTREDKERSVNKDRDRGRGQPQEKEQDVVKDRSRNRAKELDTDKVQKKDQDLDKDAKQKRGKETERDKRQEKQQDVEKSRNRNKDQEREKAKVQEKIQEPAKDVHHSKDKEKTKDKTQTQDQAQEKEPKYIKGKERTKEKTQEKEPDHKKERHRNREREREAERIQERNKESDKDRRRSKDKERDQDQDKTRGNDRDRCRGRGDERERDGEKKQRLAQSEENYNRQSGDQSAKPDCPKAKHDGSKRSAELNRRSKTESTSSSNKEDRKGSGQTADKHTVESKASEFPSYLLGGTGSNLKNFVIPKLKRDATSKCVDGLIEPRVVLDRVSLVKNLAKSSKPVIVLKRLSIDEVKRIIRDSRNVRSSKSEMLSNKRRHSVVSKKPKYVISDSEEDSEDPEDSDDGVVRKKSRKDNDKSWKCEEKRGRSSSGRHRDRSPEDSDESSPPPNLTAVARKLSKKEKQKNRKSYEPKQTVEEMMDSSTFKRFTATLDSILENLEDADFTATDDDEIPQELLLGQLQLSELSSDSAKIKAMGIFNKIPSERLVKVLNILEKNIQDSVKLSTLMHYDNESMDEEKLWRDLIMERVVRSADACLTALNIMTSPHMPKAVYIEDVIERVLQYTKFHLLNTLYPQYDPVYRVDPHGGGVHSSKSKRAKCSSSKQKVVVKLYNKVCDVVGSMSELLEIQLLTDTTILQVSTLGITPFFVENVSELQLCAITLVTAVFSRYEKHRQLILEEIFTSLARLPTSKRSLRNFRLSSDSDGEYVYIQMVSALVLQLIQCVVQLPSERDGEEEHNKKVDKDVLITNAYETAMRTAQNFLSVFLKKCGSKQGEEDYRPLFENFVHDLLSTVNRPEWPAAELLLSLLGRLLVHQFSNKQTEMALRVASLDYLGTVASRLRKDAVTSKMDQKVIDRILRETPGNDEVQQLQKALLDYIDDNVETDTSLLFARNFYIAQWYRDVTSEVDKAMKSQKERDEDSKYYSKEVESTGDIMHKAETRKKFLRKVIKTSPSQFSSLKMNSDVVDYEDCNLIVRYLASMRPFAQSFDIYLSQILRVLGESAIAVRTKAMKCLSEVVAVDPSILGRTDMQRGVHCRLMDNSTSVREAAVELLGRFVLSRPELIEQYYDMLIERILDTGISVRKRVIKILRDICLELPDFHKITEMCVKMIRRVNDEEGIKKLVNETFQKLWFTPTPNHDKEAMTRKILNITDVVLACKDTGYDWFEQLLQNLLKSEENASYKPAKKACIQLVDSLVEHILTYEESLAEDKGVSSGRLVSCITTLYLFSKIRPQLMVKHAMTMQPYLTTKCNTQNDFMVICNVAKILELVVPLIEHPSEGFLTTLEEDLMKLIIKYGMTVVQHCVSCLGAVVNKVTHNYKFVWACFNRYYGALAKLKTQHQEDPTSPTLVNNKPTLLRSLFTVGALCRHFDFDLEEFKGATKIVIKDKVLELLMYFTTHQDEEVQIKALIGLGFQFIMYPELMFVQDVKVLYNNNLSDESVSVSLKIQVLKNLQTYLQEEDSRMQEADREWKKTAKQEDLKEMGDVSSGMSSSIMQIYLKQVLESFFHTQSTVRHYALNVITLTLGQGLIHPVQCVPYLIAMGTDPEPTMKNKADNQLVEIDKKYSGFIHMKAVAGLKMSYQVQQAIHGSKTAVVRGFRPDDRDSALCSHLYTMVRGNRQHRRAFLISLLNLFDDSTKTEVNMVLFVADNLACFPYQTQDEPLFIMHHIDITLSVSGSNLLQSFKESLRKEPVPRQKNAKKKEKKKKKHKKRKYNSEDEDDSSEESSSSSSSSSEEEEEQVVRKKTKSADSDSDLDDEDAVLDRLPDNPGPLLDFASASQGVLLLLMLKQHLKNLYGFSDSKIQKYSPTESAKVYDKAVNRKSSVHFNPRQTLDFLKTDLANTNLNYESKRNIVKQFLDFKLLMEHLDREEEEEDGEANANAKNKVITSLLKGPKIQSNNHHTEAAPVETSDEDSEDDSPPARKPRKGGEAAEDSGQKNEPVEVMDIIATFCPKYKDRPQIAKVVEKNRKGYSIHWMTGTYSGPWSVAKKKDGRKKVPWVDTVKESDIIYKKITLTSGQKLSNKVVQTLRALYATKDASKK
ncbi:nipped-B-like protein B isoform X2 [Periophthalmus magnuspinnatus]|uniref:nipped-B-like protein B isoform X2 n=1 Tax=Periophthalmus magnuspinnatus TaxID=409849 RepID=UPI002436BA1C|nr:nipped-B-like protein B isoform X2 [Periophthalmus magnuspinnatus]